MSSRPFIVIEALDAGGSQTQTDLLAKKLKKGGYTVHQYHFPQEDRATGRIIYDKFLLQRGRRPFSRREQALLYIQDFFSQAEEMHRMMRHGNSREIILSDRYCTTTMAYQTIGLKGAARARMMEWITWLCWQGTPTLPTPTKVIFLDTPVEISLAHLRGKKKDFFETREKLTAIRQSYLRVAAEQKWIVISSVNEQGVQRSKRDLHGQVWRYVQRVV